MIKKIQLKLILIIPIILLLILINHYHSRYTFIEVNHKNKIATTELNWFFKPLGTGKTPLPPPDTSKYSNNHDLYYVGDTSQKIIYLTFDEGYENGYTGPMLDILKKHNVKAAFFVVKPYITTNPELVKRMLKEGHLVCNHSARHPSMAKILDFDKFRKELEDVENCYEEVTGEKMPKFFRPPMGKYSELSLKYTKDLGYKTIFWSFAYVDWEINKQPTPQFAKNKILSRTHPGEIVLLHSVSKTNLEILDSILNEWTALGYKFNTLNDLPQ